MPRFSALLESLSGADGAEIHLASDPELEGAAALDQAGKGQLSFLEKDNALSKALSSTGASALLLPCNAELQQQALALEGLLPDTPERAQQILHLQHNFGLCAEAVMAQAPMEAREPLSSVIPICRAEIQHAIHKEHARCADDVLSRRCRLAMVDAAEAERLSPLVNNELEQM